MKLLVTAFSSCLMLAPAVAWAFDCDGDGVDEIIGIGPLSKDCDGNGWPDTCDLARRFVLEGTIFEARSATSFVPTDLDGDGDTDLGVSGPPREAYMVFNDGGGNFTSMLQVDHPLGAFLLLGDLENDGDTDLFGYGARGFVPYVNQGRAVFIEGTPIDLGRAHALVLGDLDADGDLDVAAGGSSFPLELAAALQEGRGTFGSPRALGPILAVRSVCLGDWNGDGRSDLAVATGVDMVVLVNRGDLPYESAGEYPLGSMPASIMAGDMDSDGDNDLVTLNISSDGSFPPNMSVFSNAGDGNFSLPRNHLAGLATIHARLVDLDGDDDLDVLGISEGQYGVTAVWNEREKGFRTEEVWKAPFLVAVLDAADLEGDGDIDILVSISSSPHQAVLAFRNSGAGSFEVPPYESEDQGVGNLASGDFDGDGDSDLVAAGFGPPRLTTFVNAAGLHIAAVRELSQNPADLDSGDLDADGDLDLAISTGALNLFSNGGKGDFELLSPVPGVPAALYLVDADLNGDGLLDLTTTDEKGIRVLVNHGGWRFAEPQRYELGGTPNSIAAAEVDGDDKIDLLVTHDRLEGGTLSLLRNAGTGIFEISHLAIGTRATNVNAADLDRDGDTDLVLADSFESDILVLDGSGGGVFAEPRRYWSGQTGEIALHDLDLDGDVDVVSADTARRVVLLHFNTGSGSFPRSLSRPAGSVRDIVLADFDGDEDAELVLGRDERGLLILDNGTVAARRDCNGNDVPDTCDISEGILHDLDGDGLADDCGSIPFTRGDVDMSVEVNITDAVRILNWLFTGGEPLPCHSSADTDDNAAVDLTDAIFLLRFLFLSGDSPPAPFPGCGRDATIDGLGCRSARTCPR